MSRAAGLTLVELLVALAIGGVVLAAAFGASITTRRVAAAIDARATAGQRATAVPQLLAGVMARAGRGLDGCGLEVADGGRRVRASGVPLGETEARLVEVFADRDGGGRPALYLRLPPAVRQPWLEEVTAFAAVEARDADGGWRPLEHDGAARWTALRLRLAWSDGDEWVYETPLPHAPCAEAMP